MHTDQLTRPDWDALYAIAEEQDGYFTTAQAASVGFSSPLLNHHLGAQRLERVRRGIYRLKNYPPGEHEDLVVFWLWSDSRGVFSHETVLALQALGEVFPGRIHMTLPWEWRTRRLTVPKPLLLHYCDLPKEDRAWFGAVPVTTISRALLDCTEASIAPELLSTAYKDAKIRGVVEPRHERIIRDYLDRFGGKNE